MTNKYDHHISRIREAIFRGNASCFIGAGFSLNAYSIDGSRRRLPLWNELIIPMLEKLHPAMFEAERKATGEGTRNSKAQDDWNDLVQQSKSTSNALRVAEEFESAFGRPELDQIILDLTPDGQFKPGKVHRKLLEFPWDDVFTTNYDTLLEKAAKDVLHQHFDIVKRPEDLPGTSRPRIIKLHGSFRDVRPFIVTEEDFRTYPSKFAPFVNEVRVSLAENVFCLFGFGGDDPNFLAWTGWVRDQLGTYTPPIYLFSVSGGLLDFQRRMLESRNVIPIDLKEVYPEAKDPTSRILKLFDSFGSQLATNTTNWNLHPLTPDEPDDPDAPNRFVSNENNNHNQSAGKEEVLAMAKVWESNRNKYLGWHVLSNKRISDLWQATRFWEKPIVSNWEKFSQDEKFTICNEYCWRLQHSLNPIWESFADGCLIPILGDLQTETENLPQRFDLGLQLLRNYRERSLWKQHAKLFQDLSLHLENKRTRDRLNNDSIHFFKYEAALKFLTFGQIKSLQGLLAKWKLDRATTGWFIRKSSLEFECGNSSAAVKLLTRALQRVTATRKDENIPHRSIESWCLFLLSKENEIRKEYSWLDRPRIPRPPTRVDPTDQARMAEDQEDIDEEIRAEQFQQRREDFTNSNDSRVELPFNLILKRLSTLIKFDCDPTALFQEFWWQTKFNGLESKEIVKKFSPSITPNFDGGIVESDGSMRGTHWAHGAMDALRFIRLLEWGGIPIYLNEIGLSAIPMKGAVTSMVNLELQDSISPLLRLRATKFTKETLSRFHVNILGEEICTPIFIESEHGINELVELALVETDVSKKGKIENHIRFRVLIVTMFVTQQSNYALDQHLSNIFFKILELHNSQTQSLKNELDLLRDRLFDVGSKEIKASFCLKLFRATSQELLDPNLPNSSPVSIISDWDFTLECQDKEVKSELGAIGRKYVANLKGKTPPQEKRVEIIRRVELLRSSGLLTKSVEKQFVQYLVGRIDHSKAADVFFNSYVYKLAAKVGLKNDSEETKTKLMANLKNPEAIKDIASLTKVQKWSLEKEFSLNLSNDEVMEVLHELNRRIECYLTALSRNSTIMQAHFLNVEYRALSNCFEAAKKLVLLQESPSRTSSSLLEKVFERIGKSELPFVRFRVCQMNHSPKIAEHLASQIIGRLSSTKHKVSQDSYTAIAWWWEIFDDFQLPKPDARFTTAILSNLGVGSGVHVEECLRIIQAVLKQPNTLSRTEFGNLARPILENLSNEFESPESIRRFDNAWIPKLSNAAKDVLALLDAR